MRKGKQDVLDRGNCVCSSFEEGRSCYISGVRGSYRIIGRYTVNRENSDDKLSLFGKDVTFVWYYALFFSTKLF